MINTISKRNTRVSYSAEEHETWKILLQKQLPNLKERACHHYLQGLELLALPEDRIPQLSDLNGVLKQHGSWTLEPVASLIPPNQFFSMLARRKFPVATFIRRRDELDYVNEPDIFHEIVGHCPMLMHAPYADFLQRYGQEALQVTDEQRAALERLFFFTIETGLIHTPNGLRIYGGGILSSYQESIYSLDSSIPTRKTLDVAEIINTEYSLDNMQSVYYVIDDFETLYKLLNIPCADEFSIDFNRQLRYKFTGLLFKD